METIKTTLFAYALTIVFAMAIACVIPALAAFVKRLKLDPEETLDISVPTSNSIKEEEAIAVAIAAAARAQKK
jgi:hypothetical protein